MDFHASAFKEELRIYSEDMRKSRWVLCIQPREQQVVGKSKPKLFAGTFLALVAPCPIELKLEKAEVSILSWNEEKLFFDDIPPTHFKGVNATLRPLGPRDYLGLRGFISHDDLAKHPEFTEDDILRIRAEIVFTVISGGVKPVSPTPSVFPVFPRSLGEPDPSAPRLDECILVSSDGGRFCLKKQLLNGIPYFDAILKTIRNPRDGLSLSCDGETLEIVVEFLKRQTVISVDLSRKVLMAADMFGLKKLQTEIMDSLVLDLSIETAAETFEFVAENNIACLRARLDSVIPSLLEKVTGANAAKALILSAKMGHAALKKRALDVIAPDVTEIYILGGFDDISSVPCLDADVKKAAADYRAAGRDNGASQNENPALKRTKTQK